MDKQTRSILLVISVALTTLWVGAAGAVVVDDDPLKSANWDDLKTRFFGDAKVVFDDRVKVVAPIRAEDSMNVPVGVNVEALGEVEEVMVIADLNPIVKVLQFRPLAARASSWRRSCATLSRARLTIHAAGRSCFGQGWTCQ